MKIKFFAFAILFAFSSAIAFGQSPVVVITGSDDAVSKRTASFEKVWNTINERHYDPTFGGVDWKRIREQYEPLAKKAATDDELHTILRKMLGELKLSHFGIYPKNLTAEQIIRETGYAGIDIIMIDGLPVVNRVDSGSPAAATGIMPGFVLTKIDGQFSSEILKVFDKSLDGRAITDAVRKIYRERHLEAKLNGKPGTDLFVEMVGEKDSPLSFLIKRVQFTGQMSQPFGNFPSQQVHFESKRLAPDIGYIRFNMWIMPQMSKLRTAVRELSDAKALIIDLRGNPGGIGGMAPGLAGLMLNEQKSLGTMRTRDSSMDFIAFPQRDPFAGKVVILTDHGTGSTSEVFAGGMQDIGRGTIVGEPTAGGVLPSVFDTLPTGALFQYAVSDYRTPKNVLLEGRGVSPDITIAQTRKALLAGGDRQLERAIELIRK